MSRDTWLVVAALLDVSGLSRKTQDGLTADVHAWVCRRVERADLMKELGWEHWDLLCRQSLAARFPEDRQPF